MYYMYLPEFHVFLAFLKSPQIAYLFFIQFILRLVWNYFCALDCEILPSKEATLPVTYWRGQHIKVGIQSIKD